MQNRRQCTKVHATFFPGDFYLFLLTLFNPASSAAPQILHTVSGDTGIEPKARICKRLRNPGIDSASLCSLPVFLNVYEAQESIPRNEFRQPM